MRAYASRVLLILSIALAFMFWFAGTSFAAGEAVPADQSLLELAKPVLNAIVNGDWWIGAMAGLMLVVGALRKYAPTEGRFGFLGRAVASTPGIILTTFALSFAGAALTALTALGPDGAMSLAIAKTAGLVGLGAVGSYKVLHELGAWFAGTEFFKTKAPGWLQAIVRTVLALIGSNAIAKAEAAGAAAVKANPPGGAAAIVGEPEKF